MPCPPVQRSKGWPGSRPACTCPTPRRCTQACSGCEEERFRFRTHALGKSSSRVSAHLQVAVLVQDARVHGRQSAEPLAHVSRHLPQGSRGWQARVSWPARLSASLFGYRHFVVLAAVVSTSGQEPSLAATARQGPHSCQSGSWPHGASTCGGGICGGACCAGEGPEACNSGDGGGAAAGTGAARGLGRAAKGSACVCGAGNKIAS